jgi:predicted O-methyltransferase YrrM
MSVELIEKYHRFLKKNGFVLNRDKTNILYRSTNPVLLDFFSEIDSKLVKNILEIGTSNGYSFGFFRFCFPKAKVVSIDIKESPTATKVSSLFDDNFLFIKGTSDCLQKVDTMFDLVFIDGDHSFEWCKRDWINVQKNLSSRAMVVFDDLDWGDRGVERFLNSLQENKTIKYENGAPMYCVITKSR